MNHDFLNHVTINTGHTGQSPRAQVHGEIIDMLTPVITGKANRIPVVGWPIHIIRPFDGENFPIDGAAFFTLSGTVAGNRVAHLVHCAVCWDPALDEEAWKMAMQITKATHQEPSPSLKRPDATPWLAVALDPGMYLADQEAIAMLGDFERCMAWAFIEHARKNRGGFSPCPGSAMSWHSV